MSQKCHHYVAGPCTHCLVEQADQDRVCHYEVSAFYPCGGQKTPFVGSRAELEEFFTNGWPPRGATEWLLERRRT